jgi:short-subunit dehydrogenase
MKDKIVFISGSSRGLGKAIAIELLKIGSHVVINSRDEKVLEQTRLELTEYSSKVMALAGDVSDSFCFKSITEKIIEQFGRLDVLILNAGYSCSGRVEDTDDKALHTVMDVNTLSVFSSTHIALPYIKLSKGSIVFISSLAGLHGLPRTSLYSMSKMALTALAQSLKIDLKGSGVHIGIIYAGFVENDKEKTTVDCQGNDIPILPRPKWITQSKSKVAKAILRNIRRRKFKSVLSPAGKVLNYMARHFPRLSLLILGRLSKASEELK